MNGFQLLQCGFGVAALLAGPVMGAPAVYPVPQQSKLSSQTAAFSGKPSVVVRSARTQGDKLLAGVPEKSGAYKLVVSPQGKVGIGAHDERGAFYADAAPVGQKDRKRRRRDAARGRNHGLAGH